MSSYGANANWFFLRWLPKYAFGNLLYYVGSCSFLLAGEEVATDPNSGIDYGFDLELLKCPEESEVAFFFYNFRYCEYF